jgi:hypothetical protein
LVSGAHPASIQGVFGSEFSKPCDKGQRYGQADVHPTEQEKWFAQLLLKYYAISSDLHLLRSTGVGLRISLNIINGNF